jgi:hypothetical protein
MPDEQKAPSPETKAAADLPQSAKDPKENPPPASHIQQNPGVEVPDHKFAREQIKWFQQQNKKDREQRAAAEEKERAAIQKDAADRKS